MSKNEFQSMGEGIHLLQNRFCSGVPKNAKVFKSSKSHRKTLELGLVVSLVMTVSSFQISKRLVESKSAVREMGFSLTVVDDIPQTAQRQSVQAPSRPTVPIASEDEEIPEDETIEFTNIDFEEVPPPPPPLPPTIDESESIPVFVPYDEPPEPIGGYAAIQQHLVYPALGAKAGIEGMVIIWVQIGENGEVTDVKVAKSLGFESFDNAAIAAVTHVKWKPAKQRDVPVTVWIGVPVKFKLTKAKPSI